MRQTGSATSPETAAQLESFPADEPIRHRQTRAGSESKSLSQNLFDAATNQLTIGFGVNRRI